MVIETATLPGGTEAEAYSATLEASGGTETGYKWTTVSGSLPADLSLREDGTPNTRLTGTLLGSGTFTFTVEVKDSKGTSATKEFSIEVGALPPPLEIVTTELLNGATNDPYSVEITAANGAGDYRWRLTDGELPPGLTLASGGTPSTTLSGTLPADSEGEYNFTIEVRDADNTAVSATYQVNVVDDTVPLNFVTQMIADGEEGQPYSATVEIAGGEGPYSWRIQGGEIPPDLVLDTSSDQTTTTISGTPTVRGNFTFQVEARDSAGQSTRKTFFVEIAPTPPPVRIITVEIPPAEQNAPYSATISAINGSGQGYMWSIATGSLPSGLTIAPTGTPDTTISGTPTEFGSFSFDVEVADDRGNSNTVSYVLEVQEEVIPITIVNGGQTIVLPNAEGGADYVTTLTAENGFGRYNWVVSEGALPPGLTLQVPGTPSTTISGLAQALGTFTATITVYDLNNDTASARIQITVDAPSTLPTIQTPSLPDAAICGPYRQNITATGGSNANYVWTVVSGTLPPSFALTSGTPNAVISGGTGNTTGTFSFTLRVTDTFGYTDDQAFTVDIADIPGGFRWVAASNDIATSSRDRMFVMEVCGTPGAPIEVTPAGAPLNGDIYSPTSNYSAGFAPDGRALAYVGDLTTDNTYDVYIVPLTTGVPGTPINVSANLNLSGFLSAVDLRWSPDGTKLAFRADANVSGAEELFVVDVTNVLTPGPAVRVSQQFSSSSTEVYNPDYIFSPDSTKIAYIADVTSSNDRLYVVDLSLLPTGGAPGAPVDVHPGTISFTDVYGTFLWTNDSGALIYTADMDAAGMEQVWWVDVSGLVPGTPISLAPNMPPNGDCYLTSIDHEAFLNVSPDGTKLAMMCELEVDNARLPYIVDLTGPTPGVAQRAVETVPTPNRYTYSMKWSPDSTQLAFVSEISAIDNSYRGYVVDVTGILPAAARELMHPNYSTINSAYTGLYHSLQWSPDSRWIGLIGDLDLNGPYEFFVADTSVTGPLNLVKANASFTNTSADIWNVQFSPDSTKVALLGQPGNFAYQLSVVSLDNLGVENLVHPQPASSSFDMATLTTSGWSGAYTHYWTADSDNLVFIGDFVTANAGEGWMTDVSGAPPYTANRITPAGATSSQEVYRMWAQGPYARRIQDFWR